MPISMYRKYTVIDLLYCAAALAAGFALITAFGGAGDGVLKVLLRPHAWAVEAFYNLKLTYVSGIGYCAPGGSFAIGGDCLGVNFIALMFSMLVCVFIRWFEGGKKALWFLLSLFGAAISGILVSCIRIIGSIPFVSQEKFSTIHTGIGIGLYFIALLLSYLAVKKLLGVSRHERT